MFGTSIGPTGDIPGFLRPETAQGMFMNFRRMLDYVGGRMPFAAAQIGSAYRNEIAPRNGLVRVREFTMAEIEHFVNPLDKSHPKFDSIASDRLTLFPAVNQVTDGKTIFPTVGEAVRTGIIGNETLAYFMARTARFLLSVGVDHTGLRFRQHLRTEMAHYASDCWDAEILMASGWVECVGHADRACYDLEVHAKATKVSLDASVPLTEPVSERVFACKPQKGVLGKKHRGDARALIQHLESLEVAAAEALRDGLAAGPVSLVVDGKEFQLEPSEVTFFESSRMVHEKKFTPTVIEPSFGIGRIMTGIFEHCFYVRPDDADRTVFRFPPIVAPYKVALLPLDGRIPGHFVAALRSSLTARGVSVVIDESGASIGRRYARVDEIGVPFAVTVDHDTLVDHAVTVRERDSTDQLRVRLDQAPALLEQLCAGSIEWASPEAVAFSVVPSLPSAVSGSASGRLSLTIEGVDRPRGRFSRPSVPIL
jgi:glycyl-tRNA synthetase